MRPFLAPYIPIFYCYCVAAVVVLFPFEALVMMIFLLLFPILFHKINAYKHAKSFITLSTFIIHDDLSHYFCHFTYGFSRPPLIYMGYELSSIYAVYPVYFIYHMKSVGKTKKKTFRWE